MVFFSKLSRKLTSVHSSCPGVQREAKTRRKANFDGQRNLELTAVFVPIETISAKCSPRIKSNYLLRLKYAAGEIAYSFFPLLKRTAQKFGAVLDQKRPRPACRQFFLGSCFFQKKLQSPVFYIGVYLLYQDSLRNRKSCVPYI